MSIVKEAQKQIDDNKKQRLVSIAYELLKRKEELTKKIAEVNEELSIVESWIIPKWRDDRH